MSGCGCKIEIKDRSKRRVLIQFLTINAFMFLLELSVGWWARSTALIADALDILRRLFMGGEPVSALMMGMGLLAPAANIICLVLIAAHRDGGIHMRAS